MPHSDVTRFSHLGGATPVDLANTVHWRLAPAKRSDKLRTFADAVVWAAESGVIDTSELEHLHSADARTGSRELARIVALREGFYAATLLNDHGAADRLRLAASAALAAASAVNHGGVWTWWYSTTPESVTHRIALQLVALLTDERASLITQCADDECGWIYLDTSPKHNRRWCSSADCGNRNRVRAHKARSQAAPRPIR